MEDETKNTPSTEPTPETATTPAVVSPEVAVASKTESEAAASPSETPSRGRKINYTYVAIAVAILVIVGAYLYTRGYIVAATVNGSPISRLSVINMLEEQSGKQTLEAAISKKLIEDAFAKQNITATPDEVAVEIKKIEANVASQGGTLDQALVAEGMTRAMLEDQISTKVRLEKLLSDKVEVSSLEVETYMATNKITLPEGADPEAVKTQVKDQLKQQKLQAEAEQWISGLTATAKIKYYVSY